MEALGSEGFGGAPAARVYYHGSGRPEPTRASVGNPSWDRRFFVSHDPEVAALYGPDVREVEVSGDARVLVVESMHSDLWRSHTRPGFSAVDTAVSIVEEAEAEGYDVVEFHRPHDFVGHVVVNEGAVVRGGRAPAAGSCAPAGP